MKSIIIRLLCLFFLTVLLAACSNEKSALPEKIEIIPKPAETKFLEGTFDLSSKIKINQDESAHLPATNINHLKSVFSTTAESKNTAKIELKIIDDQKPGDEGYNLIIRKNNIKISAPKEAGLFYGIQSLIQLVEKAETNTLKCMEITDVPEFDWRGMHLDVCRHFFPVKFVKKYIDLLAMHKMNTFHWHLTEDQGWRIEIKEYPKLTEIGSVRSETMVGKNWDQFDGKIHKGYYTQEEIKEVVEYAKERFITIVPEIEMPGHSLAALAAYPEYGCTGGPYEVAKTWGVFEDVYCAGKDSTFIFLENVLSEVMELFPGKYIHVGGDECPKTRWKDCPDCQRRIKEEGLKNEEELQSYFIRRIEKFLLKNNRKLIGWDEILEGGLAPEATVMSWRGEKGGIKAAQKSHDVVMCPNDICYFDHYQGDPESEPLAIGGLTTLKDVYQYQPVPEGLEESRKHHILGAQGNLWTEYITTAEKLEYMALPRLCALSEVVWNKPQNRKWVDFKNRMQKHKKYLEKNQYNYRRQN